MATVGQQAQQQQVQQQQQQQQQLQNATQLEFNQAMKDFKTMFPEMDEEVIEAVLRGNQGAVDSTIDQLLAMATDNENEKLRTEMDARENAEAPPSYSPTTPPPTYQQAFLGSPGTPLRVKKSWNPPLLCPLPAGFLRIARSNRRTKMGAVTTTVVLSSQLLQRRMEENERQRKQRTADDPELTQYLEDERVALFLQNKEFMRELRTNKDFLSTLERDSEGSKRSSVGAGSSDTDGDTDSDQDRPGEDQGAFGYSRGFNAPEDSDAAFREKLKNMGKMSRRKFAQLARLFTRQKKRTAKKILGEGSVACKDNLLLEDNDYVIESDSDAETRKVGTESTEAQGWTTGSGT